MKKSVVAVCFAVLLLLVACDNNEKWTIQGSVTGSKNDTVFVKHLVDNQYQVLDKKAIKSNGRFAFKLEKKAHPAYYFLQLKNSSNLVIVRDSSDLVEIKAEASRFSDADISGSLVSQRIQSCVKSVKVLRGEYAAFMAKSEEEQDATRDALLAQFEELKKSIGQEIYKDPASLYSYYALYQRIDEQNMLFSPYVEEDYNYYAAVATSYGVFRKDDPRTKALHDVVMGALSIKRKAALQEMVANAPAGIPEIVKKDVNGKERRLSDIKNKVIILNFWMSQNQESLRFNEELKRLYMRYRRSGLEVFQVSSDQSKLLWTEAIQRQELPWINVCDCARGIDQHFTIYNVKSLPTTYLIGRDGALINRFNSAADLEAAIKDAL